MNYIIEGDIDFWNELNNHNEVSEKEKICLLTNEKLSRNFITLPCGHQFNYLALCDEVTQSKQYLKYNKFPLKSNQIRCPYCRTRHNNLLLWIPNEKVKYNKLIHSLTKPLKHKECQYCYKSGKSKGKKCLDIRAYEDKDGLVFCRKHRKQHEKKKKNSKTDKTCEQLTKHEKTFLKRNLKKVIQDKLKSNNITFKKSDTKLILMRTLQLNKIPLTLYDKQQNEIILSTPMYSV
jgi:hypothetical protein